MIGMGIDIVIHGMAVVGLYLLTFGEMGNIYMLWACIHKCFHLVGWEIFTCYRPVTAYIWWDGEFLHVIGL